MASQGPRRAVLAGDGAVGRRNLRCANNQFLDAGIDEVSQNGEGFGRVLGALPNAEGISIHTASNLAIQTDRHGAKFELAPGLGQVAHAAQVPGRVIQHGNLAGSEDVAAVEIGAAGDCTVRDIGLWAPMPSYTHCQVVFQSSGILAA